MFWTRIGDYRWSCQGCQRCVYTKTMSWQRRHRGGEAIAQSARLYHEANEVADREMCYWKGAMAVCRVSCVVCGFCGLSLLFVWAWGRRRYALGSNSKKTQCIKCSIKNDKTNRRRECGRGGVTMMRFVVRSSGTCLRFRLESIAPAATASSRQACTSPRVT